MLVLTPTYRNAIKASDLDPETFPISRDAGWNTEKIKFDGPLAAITFKDVDFSAVSNVNAVLTTSMKNMLASSLDSSQTKGSITSIKSDPNNSATLKVKDSTLDTLVKSATTNLQVASYINTITSDTGTGINASGTDHSTSIQSDVATTLETKFKVNETSLQTTETDASITTSSHVITLR